MEEHRNHFLWILAHPDDEIMAIPILMHPDTTHFIVFLTNGSANGSQESIRVRRRCEAEVVRDWYIRNQIDVTFTFFGNDNLLSDALLFNEWDHHKQARLLALAKNRERFDLVISTSFEGAHQDHDIAALIAHKVSVGLSCQDIYFSTYRALGKSRFLFHLMSPERYDKSWLIPRMTSIKLAAGAIFRYRSQMRTWVGLGPVLFWKYLFAKFTTSQGLGLHDLDKPRIFFYENRRRAVYKNVESAAKKTGLWLEKTP